MKRISTLVLVGAAALASAFAQQTQAPPDSQAPPPQAAGQPHGHGRTPDAQLKALTKKLNLSAEQQAQLRPILEDRATQMQAIRNDSNLSRTDRRSKLKDLREESTQKLEAVLTAEQKQTYEAMPQKSKEHRNGKHANNQDS